MSTVATVGAAAKKTVISLHEVLVDLVKLENPVTAAAVAAFVLTLIPGPGSTSPALVAIVAAVGTVAAVVEKVTGA